MGRGRIEQGWSCKEASVDPLGEGDSGPAGYRTLCCHMMGVGCLGGGSLSGGCSHSGRQPCLTSSQNSRPEGG